MIDREKEREKREVYLHAVFAGAPFRELDFARRDRESPSFVFRVIFIRLDLMRRVSASYFEDIDTQSFKMHVCMVCVWVYLCVFTPINLSTSISIIRNSLLHGCDRVSCSISAKCVFFCFRKTRDSRVFDDTIARYCVKTEKPPSGDDGKRGNRWILR